MNAESRKPRGASLVAWLLTLLTYDGLLPLLIFLVPIALNTLVPGRRGLVEIVSLVLPSAAFCVRWYLGRRRILTNACSRRVRTFQQCVFIPGLLLLALLDCFGVLILGTMPNAPLHPKDRRAAIVLYLVYLVCMAVALYPGRVRVRRRPRPEVFTIEEP